MTIAELIKSFLDSSRERIKTPITGSFIITFIIWNWRPILLLMFSDTSIESRISEITILYCNFGAIFWPFVIAIGYVGLIQYIMWGFDETTTKAINKRVENKYARKVYELKKYADVLDEQRKNEDVRSGNRDKQMLNDEIDSLKMQIDTINKSNKDSIANYEKIIQDQRKVINPDRPGKLFTPVNFNEADSFLSDVINQEIISYEHLSPLQQALFMKQSELIINGNDDIIINDEFKQIFEDNNWMDFSKEPPRLTTVGRLLYEKLRYTIF